MAEKSIELDSVEIAAAVFGNCDRNIRMLEKEFSVTAVCRGTMLRISGEPANVAAAARAVEGMLLLIENHTPLEDQTVRYCLSLAHDRAVCAQTGRQDVDGRRAGRPETGPCGCDGVQIISTSSG